MPAGGLFGKKKDDDRDKENQSLNVQNGGDIDQLNSSNESEKTPKDKRSKVGVVPNIDCV